MKSRLSEEQIDKIVVEQADNDSEWEEPINVRKTEPAALSIPADIAVRAEFLARLHRERGVEEWLRRIIRERIEIEEVSFTEAKRDIALHNS